MGNLQDTITTQITIINDNLVALNASQEKLEALNDKANEAAALARVFLTNKGPYQDIVMNVENTFVSTTVTVTNDVIINLTSRPGWQGPPDCILIIDEICDAIDTVINFFKKLYAPYDCFIFWIFPCQRCTGKNSFWGPFRILIPLPPKAWCLISNAVVAVCLYMLLSLLNAVLGILEKGGKATSGAVKGVWKCSALLLCCFTCGKIRRRA